MVKLFISLLFIAVLEKATIQAASHVSKGTVIAHHNFGYAFQAMRSVHVVSTTAKMTFIVDLPVKMNTTTSRKWNCTSLTTAELFFKQAMTRSDSFGETAETSLPNHTCSPISIMMSNLMQTQDKIHHEMQKHIDVIYHILHSRDDDPFNRTKRAWFPSIGRFFRRIIGTGTVDTEKQLREQMARVEKLALQSSAVWQEGSSRFMAATKLNSNRIENLSNLTRMQGQSISSLYDAVRV